MKKLSVSVVIPVLNNSEVLKQNLPHVIATLEKYGKENVELILSNDNSIDDSLEILKRFQKSAPIPVTVLDHKTANRGFSVNVNRGARVAKNDILVLLGTDVQPELNFLEPLLAHFSDEKVFAVGAANESDEDDGHEVLRGRGIGKWEKGFLLHSHGEMINDKTLWVDCGSGAFRRSMWNDIGGLQELYTPFYWEDVDISYRAQKMGYRVLIEKKSRVKHEHKKGVIKKQKSSKITTTAYRNQFFFVWLNITDSNLLVNHLRYIPYHLLAAVKDRNWLMLKGFGLALLQLPRVLSERAKVTPRFKVSDRAILSQFTPETR